MVTTQLRLLAGGDLPQRTVRTRSRRAELAARPKRQAVRQLDARTRQIGQSGVAEARRRLAEINATADRAHDLVRAS